MITVQQYVDRKAQELLRVMRRQNSGIDINKPQYWRFTNIKLNIFDKGAALESFCRLAQRVGVNCDSYLEEARQIQKPYLDFMINSGDTSFRR